MDKFVFVINGYKLYVYEMVNKNNAEIFRIRGNRYDELDLDDPEYSIERMQRYIMDTLNYGDFSNCGFTVIYNNVNSEVLKVLSEYFLPCKDWQVNKLEDILPSLLLKLDKIKPGEKKIVSYGKDTWLVEITNDGESIMEEGDQESEVKLQIDDIPVSLYANYSFTTDKEEINNLKNKLDDTENLLEKEKSEKKDLIEKKDRKIKELKSIIQDKENKISNLKDEVNKNELKNELLKKRTIVRFDQQSVKDILSHLAGCLVDNLEHDTISIEWKKDNLTQINNNENIALGKYKIGEICEKKEIKSSADGYLFKLVSEGTELKDNQAIAVISDKRDNLENIKKWLKKNEIDF